MLITWTVVILLLGCRAEGPADAERDGRRLGEPAGEIEPMESDMKIILDFSEQGSTTSWSAIDDVVMGGVSSSRMLSSDEGFAVFSGTVSLESGGGFASVRSAPAARDLSAYGGLAVRVRGDGKTYKLNLRTDAELDGVTYRVSFPTEAGKWEVLRFPFAEFRPTFRGRVVAAADPLDPSQITTLGFLISDKQAGPFRLEIAWVGSWR